MTASVTRPMPQQLGCRSGSSSAADAPCSPFPAVCHRSSVAVSELPCLADRRQLYMFRAASQHDSSAFGLTSNTWPRLLNVCREVAQ